MVGWSLASSDPTPTPAPSSNSLPFPPQVYIAAFAVSAYSSTYHRAGCKPFNPVLGETYECERPDRGFRFISEQVWAPEEEGSLMGPWGREAPRLLRGQGLERGAGSVPGTVPHGGGRGGGLSAPEAPC